MKTLAVANQKGGVGKSTLTVHLAYAAVEAGLRVLLVDMDKQGSLSISFPPANEAQPGLLASSLYNAEPTDAAPEYIKGNFAIIRADDRLALLDGADGDFIKRPAQHLRRFANDFDLCLIDTPGLIGMKLYAALAAADAVICPVSVGLFESAGLAELWKFIKAVKTKGYNPRLRLMGMIPSKVNTKSPEEREALSALRAQFGAAILPETLAERASVKQAISRRRPVWVNTKGAGHLTAAKEWKAACKSILVNLGSITK
jgi:chromosome partitioning protein